MIFCPWNHRFRLFRILAYITLLLWRPFYLIFPLKTHIYICVLKSNHTLLYKMLFLDHFCTEHSKNAFNTHHLITYKIFTKSALGGIKVNHRDSSGLVPDHCNKAIIAIKWTTSIFCFPMNIKVTFTAYCSLLKVGNSIMLKNVHIQLKNTLLLKSIMSLQWIVIFWQW